MQKQYDLLGQNLTLEMIQMKKIPVIIAALSITLVLTNCASQGPKARFTNVISVATENDNLYLDNNFTLIASDVEITLNRHFLVYIPLTGWYTFDDETAANELLFTYGADLVTNLKVEKKFLFLLYYNRYYVVASGNVWRRKEHHDH